MRVSVGQNTDVTLKIAKLVGSKLNNLENSAPFLIMKVTGQQFQQLQEQQEINQLQQH